MDTQQDPRRIPRQQTTNACEACRAAKVKCQASNQPGTCRRCLDSKRECIFKTGPRTRRPRQSKLNKTAPRPPPPAGPSKTFTIDVPMPAEDHAANSLDALRCSHETHINSLLPPDSPSEDEGEGDSSSLFPLSSSSSSSRAPHATPSTAGSAPTSLSSLSAAWAPLTPSSLPLSGPPPTAAASMGVRPRFNLDSAGALLGRFRADMMPRFPAVALDENGGGGPSVAEMASRRPFVLLAVLAAASGCRTLQGHGLYDEEFRKILGLKFVAGGERSLELLQGLVIYCAWYPFHLRPKSKQVFQYVRMAADIVHDLELDQDPETEVSLADNASEARLEEVRTYLAAYCLVSQFTTTWRRPRTLMHTEYTAKCCDLLERASDIKGDHVLAWQVRFQHVAEEIRDFQRNDSSAQNRYRIELMQKGMDAQLNEWESRISPDISMNTSICLSFLFTRALLSGAFLITFPSVKRPLASAPETSGADPARLASVVPALRAFLDAVVALPAAELNAFTGSEWGAFIRAVILGVRMSFPLPECPGWDHGRARREIAFGGYLERMLCMGDEGRAGGTGKGRRDEGSKPPAGRQNMDVLSASKVVLEVVKQKYDMRCARMERQHQAQQRRREMQSSAGLGPDMDPISNLGWDAMPLDKDLHGCPMMDGSLESYFPYWNESFTAPSSSGTGIDNPPAGIETDAQPATYTDLWATLTTGWSQPDFDFNGT